MFLKKLICAIQTLNTIGVCGLVHSTDRGLVNCERAFALNRSSYVRVCFLLSFVTTVGYHRRQRRSNTKVLSEFLATLLMSVIRYQRFMCNVLMCTSSCMFLSHAVYYVRDVT